MRRRVEGNGSVESMYYFRYDISYFTDVYIRDIFISLRLEGGICMLFLCLFILVR